MADIVYPLPYSSSKPAAIDIDIDEDDDDVDNTCSICLEPFDTSLDPPSVTNCKHEYHLQCILEWSQRRTECPICWQTLALKDAASQELLAAVENERNLRSKRSAHHVHRDHDINHICFVDATSFEDGSDFETRIMRHFSAAARRARFVGRRGREIIPNIGYARQLYPDTRSDQTHILPRFPTDDSFDGDSPVVGSVTTITALHSDPSVLNVEPLSVANRTKSSQHLPESPRRSSSSEFSAFSDSFKSKFSAASSRYKESISKGTKGFKEKLLARNISVKELGKGVQREMNAGIAGVTRIIERLDLASKRNGVSAHLSSCTRGTSNVSSERNDEEENAGEHAHAVDSVASSCVQSNSLPKFGDSTC